MNDRARDQGLSSTICARDHEITACHVTYNACHCCDAALTSRALLCRSADSLTADSGSRKMNKSERMLEDE